MSKRSSKGVAGTPANQEALPHKGKRLTADGLCQAGPSPGLKGFDRHFPSITMKRASDRALLYSRILHRALRMSAKVIP